MSEPSPEYSDHPSFHGHYEPASGEMLNRILGALEELGPKPDQIAITLHREGVRGFQVDASCCPISNWLRKKLDADLVTVSRGHGTVYFRDVAYSFLVPDAISHFISLFDSPRCHFKDLIIPREERPSHANSL